MARNQSIDLGAYSLTEVHGTVQTQHTSVWRRLLAFAGPAYLVSVGYMDPGNWATDLEGGARFGYRLLWVLVASNLIALLLQTLASRLGIVTRRDLAQACRDEYPRIVSYCLWLLCELAIIACDLAEVLGAAIGLNLLFHLPLMAGVLVTAADTLLVLWFTRLGIRVIEAFILALIATIAGCFAFEIYLAKPALLDLGTGLIPRLNESSLYLAVAIFGATVMPHNLYLHSALVQTREIGNTEIERRRACRYNLFDSAFALNGALFVNAAILVVAAAVFFTHHIVVTEIQQADKLLTPLVGTTAASVLFGAALLCSGQSSTLTGTMAGQIVMEGFLRFRIRPWLRRAITRSLAIIPAALTLYLFGNKGTTDLIVLSQVILNLQLPFAVIPLVVFTSDRKRMGDFVSPLWLKTAAWGCAAFILVLNAWLTWDEVRDWYAASGRWGWLVIVLATLVGSGVLLLLFAISSSHARREMRLKAEQPVAVTTRAGTAPVFTTPVYKRILVPVDHTEADREALGNAVAVARLYGARIILMHVEQDVTSQLFGSMSSTAEISEGRDYMAELSGMVEAQGIAVEIIVSHGQRTAAEIARTVKDTAADLVVMASHGHRGIKDIIFGTTINSVRHRVRVPLLVVRPGNGSRT